MRNELARLKTYKLALLTGWHWEDREIAPGDPLYTEIGRKYCYIKLANGNYKISRFCLPNGRPITRWKTLPIKIDPPLRAIFFWWITVLVHKVREDEDA